MADWGAGVRAFQEGSEWNQRRRYNDQMERVRTQALAIGDRELKAVRGREQDVRDAFPDETAGLEDAPYADRLKDPVAYRFFGWVKSMFTNKNKGQAVDTGGSEIAPTDSVAVTAPAETAGLDAAPAGEELESYADGGAPRARVVNDQWALRMPESMRRTMGRQALEDPTAEPTAAAMRAVQARPSAYSEFVPPEATHSDKPPAQGLGNAYPAPAAAPAPAPGRTALASPTPPAAAPGSRPPVVPRSALPAAAQQKAPAIDMVDFSQVDADAKDVPNMTTDEWKRYRKMIIRDAARRGQSIEEINDRITTMQMKGFASYGQQGLALQQAGNVRGAMAAYRAAFQYFPNGNDVEFGTRRDNKTGQMQLIGFGKDEKTGKIVPGTELVMDPERVGVMLEMVTKSPEAYRMWTKDHREAKQADRRLDQGDRQLTQRASEGAANRAVQREAIDVNRLRADAALFKVGAGGGLKQSDMRAAQVMFANELMMNGIADRGQALELGSVMAQLKQRQPQLDETTIMRMVLQRAGVLEAPE